MKRNYNYAKLIDGKLEYAPNKLIIGEEQVFNAPAEIYSERGYLPVVKSEMPESGDNFYYSPVYIEKGGVIVQEWERVEIPDEATEADYINALEDLGVSFDE